MSKIDCNITENYLKEKTRMTKYTIINRYSTNCGISCKECPLSMFNNGYDLHCRDFERVQPAEAIAVVQKWSDEHPMKTIKDDFLEKHPNAPKADTGTPLACAWRAGYLDEDGCLCGKCTECWNRPLSEVQK